ncbi:MAG: nitroreductase family protein [Desulfobacterota bacterium]|nr:nitroreductase family protein [Thermodesulfobacteriota bacterium]
MIRFIKNLLYLLSGKACVPQSVRQHELLACIIDRRSCRSFTDEEISPDAVTTVLEAGRFAPSAVNLQTWSFITFSRAEWRKTFERPIPFNGAYAIMICADIFKLKDLFPEMHDTPYVNIMLAVFNAGLAAMNMTIAAEALGLRSIFLSETGRTGLLDIDFLRDRLSLPNGVLPLTTLVLGKPSFSVPGIPPRQPWDAVVMQNRYEKTAGDRLRNWYDQMLLGFKITHPFSNLKAQLAMYRAKMAIAEKTLRKIFHDCSL